jgi:hypothetical protein
MTGTNFLDLDQKAIFLITEDYDARLSTMGEQMLVLLDRKDAHGRDSAQSPLLLEGAIFAKSDLTICDKSLKAIFFVLINLQPNFLVRM